MADEAPDSWVVAFDCAEAVLVEGITQAEAWTLRDDFGCVPRAVYPLAAVRLKGMPWMKNGWLRVEMAGDPDA